jgi:hypothetical protein
LYGRQLHITYGESENETNNNNTFPNENNFSGVREMPALPAFNSQPYAKTHTGKIISPEKEDQPPKTQRLLSHKKEEGNHASIQGELATSQEERQVKNKELFGGGQDCDPCSHGQHDEAPEQKGQKRQEIKEPKNDTLDNACAVLILFYNTHNSEIYLEVLLNLMLFIARKLGKLLTLLTRESPVRTSLTLMTLGGPLRT